MDGRGSRSMEPVIWLLIADCLANRTLVYGNCCVDLEREKQRYHMIACLCSLACQRECGNTIAANAEGIRCAQTRLHEASGRDIHGHCDILVDRDSVLVSAM